MREAGLAAIVVYYQSVSKVMLAMDQVVEYFSHLRRND